MLEMLKGDESILDLGCGNGEFARELAKRGHRGLYLGVDFSLPLLREAECSSPLRVFLPDFCKWILLSCQLSAISYQQLVTGHVDHCICRFTSYSII